MTPVAAVFLSFATGAMALAYEMLWFRAYSLALMARPQAFGVLLGGYLGGIALGAILVRRWCERRPQPAGAACAAAWSIVAAATGGGLLVPLLARVVTVTRHWELAVTIAAAASVGFGATLPLLAHASFRSDASAGRDTARLYAANIAGSVLGAVVTGFFLLDHWTMATLLTAITGAELLTAIVLFTRGDWNARTGVAVAAALAAAFWIAQPRLYAGVLERLFFRMTYVPGQRFLEVVENRSGVIGVTADGAVYGSGVYDGMFNIRLERAGENFIQRAYAIAAFHPAPRRVLLIGLSSGSWAAVIANQPGVRELRAIEINPGYLPLIARHPPSDGLLHDPRVHIEIDDGRHWLQRHPAERFDLIVSNTVYSWRANASALLSVEFMQLARAHLREGGVLYYNATEEPRAERTGATIFPYAWRLYNMMAVSDARMAPDLDRVAGLMRAERVYGAPTYDASNPANAGLVRLVVDDIAADLESRDRILARTQGAALITDDNMGTEWRLAARYRVW